MTHSSIAPKPSPTWTPTVVAFCDEPKVLLDVDAQAQWLIRKAVTLGHPTNRQVEVPEAWAKEAVDIAVTELQTYSWSVQKITKAGKITQLVLKR